MRLLPEQTHQTLERCVCPLLTPRLSGLPPDPPPQVALLEWSNLSIHVHSLCCANLKATLRASPSELCGSSAPLSRSSVRSLVRLESSRGVFGLLCPRESGAPSACSSWAMGSCFCPSRCAVTLSHTATEESYLRRGGLSLCLMRAWHVCAKDSWVAVSQIDCCLLPCASEEQGGASWAPRRVRGTAAGFTASSCWGPPRSCVLGTGAALGPWGLTGECGIEVPGWSWAAHGHASISRW